MSENHKAAVLGLGVSGEAAARLLHAEGWAVSVFDADGGPVVSARAEALRSVGVAVCLGDGLVPEEPFELAVVSPGIPVHSPWILDLRRRGVPVISELEIGWRRHSGRTIAVTGSSGKSTAVKWLAESLARAGRTVAIAGNYGPPVCAVVGAAPAPEWLVLEVSSFQLETVDQFRPNIGVLLNIHPNHLDRHGDFETYRALKWRLFAHMGPTDTAVIPSPLRSEAPASGPRIVTFGATGEGARYAWEDGVVRYEEGAVLDIRGTWFDNPVLGLTAAAAAAALEAADIPLRFAEEAARAFRPLPHRMMLVAEIGGVRYVDDSKATCTAAMAAALHMAGRPVRLIAGGLPKGEDYATVANVLSERAVKVYLIGMAASAMAQAWSEVVPCELCGDLDQAVERARQEARRGETVLLSPGCASFDQFESYAERGARFARLVRAADAEGTAASS